MGNICTCVKWCLPNFNLMRSSFNKDNKLIRVEVMYNKLVLMEDNIHDGLSKRIFVQHVFSQYPELSLRIYRYLIGKTDHTSIESERLTKIDFLKMVNKIINCKSIDEQHFMYITIFSNGIYMDRNNFHTLLLTIYNISVDFHPAGSISCHYAFEVLQSVINGAFQTRTELSLQEISVWMINNTSKLIPILHCYVVNVFSSGCIDKQRTNFDLFNRNPKDRSMLLDLTSTILPLSIVWILSSSLPNVYTNAYNRPIMRSILISERDIRHLLVDNIDLSIPTHWTVLYKSYEHGYCSNRFMNQLLGYTAPTITFIYCEENIEICICASIEWQESVDYWGDSNCFLIELSPLYRILQQGTKIYSNFNVHGFPQGIFVGSDHNKPSIVVNDEFTEMAYRDAIHKIINIKVCGCGSRLMQETYLKKKQWLTYHKNVERIKLFDAKTVPCTDEFLMDLKECQKENNEVATTNSMFKS